MTLVSLDPQGRLVELRAVPPVGLRNVADASALAAAAERLLTEAALDPLAAEQVLPASVGPMPGPTAMSWIVPAPEVDGRVLKVDATFVGARPTWFRVAALEGSAAGEPGPATEGEAEAAGWELGVVFFGFFALAAVLAFANHRAGRWDRRGAMRLAIAAFALCLVSLLVEAHHVLTVAAEARRVFSIVAYGATRALMTWLLYVAMEPLIRRLHPTSLVSWSRLLQGRFRDPAVGRDVLVGLAVAALQIAAMAAWVLIRGWRGTVLPGMWLVDPHPILTVPAAVGQSLRTVVVAVGLALGFLLVYALLRSLFGGARSLAVLAFWALLVLYVSNTVVTGLEPVDDLVVGLVVGTCYTLMAVRGGLLSFIVYLAAAMSLWYSVPTADPGDWFFPAPALTTVTTFGLTAFGVWAATGSRQLLRSS
jgi:hypothetical protein